MASAKICPQILQFTIPHNDFQTLKKPYIINIVAVIFHLNFHHHSLTAVTIATSGHYLKCLYFLLPLQLTLPLYTCFLQTVLFTIYYHKYIGLRAINLSLNQKIFSQQAPKAHLKRGAWSADLPDNATLPIIAAGICKRWQKS